MHAGLALQPAIGVLALHQQRRRFDAGALAFALFDQLQLVAMPLRPARVHAEQHLRPVLALGAACAGMDFEIGVVGVRLARQHRFQPQLFGALGERFDGLLGVGDHGRVVFGFGEFDQARRVGELVFERAHGGHGVVQPLALAHQLLGFLRIVPDRRVFGARVQFIEAADGLVPVKDASSAGRQPAGSLRRCVRFRGAWHTHLGGGDIGSVRQFVKAGQ